MITKQKLFTLVGNGIKVCVIFLHQRAVRKAAATFRRSTAGTISRTTGARNIFHKPKLLEEKALFCLSPCARHKAESVLRLFPLVFPPKRATGCLTTSNIYDVHYPSLSVLSHVV